MSAVEQFPRITPFLWFDSSAEEAVDVYPVADPARASADLIKHPKAMQAMLEMKKIDIVELERAAQS